MKVKRSAAGGTTFCFGEGLAILPKPDNNICQGLLFGVGSRLLAEPMRRLVTVIQIGCPVEAPTSAPQIVKEILSALM